MTAPLQSMDFFPEELTKCDLTGLMEFLFINTTEPRTKVTFRCPKDSGNILMQRIRMRISRLRAKAKQKGKKLTHFRLRHEVFPTATYDAVVVWREVSENAKVLQVLDSVEI